MDSYERTLHLQTDNRISGNIYDTIGLLLAQVQFMVFNAIWKLLFLKFFSYELF